MLGLLFRQSKFWSILLLLTFFTIVGSATYYGNASSTETKKAVKKRTKVNVADLLSDFPGDQRLARDNQSTSGINRNDLLNLVRPSQGCVKLQPELYQLSLETYQDRYALVHSIILINNKARVSIVVSSPVTQLPSGYMIDTQKRFKQNIIADVPVYLLCSLANETGIDQIRIPTSAELLDLSGATGSVGISELLNQAKGGYAPTESDYKKYGIDPSLFNDLLDKLKKTDIKVSTP